MRNAMDDRFGQGKEFLGAGIAFPFRVDAEGRIVMNGLEDHVKQSILLILDTTKGERVMAHDFGSDLHSLVFEPMNATTMVRVQHAVRDALLRYEPRIDLLDVKVTVAQQSGFFPVTGAAQEGTLLVDVQYRVRRTDAVFNLVYPFYLQRGAL